MKRSEKFVWATTAGLPLAALAMFLTVGPSAIGGTVLGGDGSCGANQCSGSSDSKNGCADSGQCSKNGCTSGGQKCIGPGWGSCGSC
jgi:hypothetical protein